ncbi:hypothetical protein LOZ66_001347 [Ophidiomyces ophidiicola]|nr:hypothetical protein LOZ66_001347 [Ophidiomyces ophidiicola]
MYSFRYYLDSWIEVASQPSSSSLSSSAANDEIVTTGLRVPPRQMRGNRQIIAAQDLNITYSHRHSVANDSSQEEYEETESDSDRILSSSNEDIRASRRPTVTFIPGNSSTSDVAMSSEDDDNLTALGPSNRSSFTPQPNVFSHPPASQTNIQSQAAYPSESHAANRIENRTRSHRNSRSSIQSSRRFRNQHPQHSPYNIYSPSHQADHDAALRASLSTLLSCAAAARGLTKRDSQCQAPERLSSHPEPSSFRLVPETVTVQEDAAGQHNTSNDVQHRSTSLSPSKRSRSPIQSTTRVRRKASPSKTHTVAPTSSKKTRRTTSETSSLISPTIMTWVVSAGVVVLFSAISFSAGYVIGREVGRTEGSQALYNSGVGNGISGARTSTGCGKEAVKGGLRQFRWVSGGSGSAVAV